MNSQIAQMQDAIIKQQCKALRMPTVALQFSTLAEQAVREKKTHTGYLEALLTVEVEERERNTIDRRIKDAHLPVSMNLAVEFSGMLRPASLAGRLLGSRSFHVYICKRASFHGFVQLLCGTASRSRSK
jgi:hypothetical protein